MKNRHTLRVTLSATVALLSVTGLVAATWAQQRPDNVGLPDDWSHQHLIFSNPGTAEEMLNTAVSEKALSKWLATQDNPRFQLQRLKGKAGEAPDIQHPAIAHDNARAQQAMGADPGAKTLGTAGSAKKKPNTTLGLEQDWNIGIGAPPAPAVFPAKYTFNPFATPSCTDDYVVFPINVAASTPQANLIGFNNLYRPASGVGFCGSGLPTFKFAYRIGSGVIRTSPTLSLDGTKIAFVESVAGASKFHVLKIGTTGNNGSSTAGVIAGSARTNVSTVSVSTLSAESMLASGVSQQIDVTTNTGDRRFVVNDYVQIDSEIMLVTAVGGSTLTLTRAQLGSTIAAHSIGATVTLLGIVSASTVIRVDSTAGFNVSDIIQIDSEKIQLSATAGNITTCGSVLLIPCFKAVSRGVLATTAASHAGGAVVTDLTVVNNAVDTTPASPANLGAQVTRSSPFVHYNSDTAYVGDDAGVLHKFTCVFDPNNTACTLTEVNNGSWPFTVAPGVTLTGAVVNGSKIIVAGSSNNMLYCVTTAGAACSLGTNGTNPSIAVGTTTGILDAPIIDGSTNYVFVAGQTATDAVLVQIDGTLSSTVTVVMGQENETNNIHNGAFSAGYLYGANASAGHMYFCGHLDTSVQAVTTPKPVLYRVGFSASGLVNATRTSDSFLMGNNNNQASECTPLTALYNPNAAGGAQDLLFIGMGDHGCTTLDEHCVASLDITSSFPTAFKNTFEFSGGGGGFLNASAIVVDNVSDVSPVWLASNAYVLGTPFIVDSNGNVQRVTTAGTSGSPSHPTWNTTVGGTTSDGTVTWTMQGPYTGSWQASHVYAANSIVTDSSNRYQRTTAGGTSGATQPAFTGTTTADNTITWTNLGTYVPSSVASIYISHEDTAYKLTQAGLQ